MTPWPMAFGWEPRLSQPSTSRSIGLSFKLYNNSNSGSSYSARDVAMFVRIGTTGAFTQFGNHGRCPPSGTESCAPSASPAVSTSLVGQTVEIRLAFTDRTRTNQDAQGATRVGSIDISAVAFNPPTVIANTITPGAGPVSHPTNGNFTRTFGQFSTNPYWGRGQTFTAADTGDANTRWSVTELALLAKTAQTLRPGRQHPRVGFRVASLLQCQRHDQLDHQRRTRRQRWPCGR